MNSSDKRLAAIKLHAEKHEIIKTNSFETEEEYVLHLMHLSDYERAALLATDLNVLDIGCNCGYGTSILAKKCKEIIGVDVSKKAISCAIDNYRSSNINFTVVDGISLPFQDHHFDMITSFQVIEHLVDVQSYLDEIKRVLKPDGLLLITTPNAAIRLHPGQKPWNSFHVHEFRYDELFSILQTNYKYTNVIGQFAESQTYDIEYNRCISARGYLQKEMSIHRRVARKILMLTLNLRNITRTNPRNVYSNHPKSKLYDRHSIDDFYYKSVNQDKSLSLVAFCSNDQTKALIANSTFTSNR